MSSSVELVSYEYLNQLMRFSSYYYSCMLTLFSFLRRTLTLTHWICIWITHG